MPGRGIADVVFCLDASTSMKPVADATRQNIVSFAEGLRSEGQDSWDLRLDFFAHATSNTSKGLVFRAATVRSSNGYSVTYDANARGHFTSDINEFRAALGRVVCGGDETSLVALDTCLDFPWRKVPHIHRVVVMLTDEPMETGLMIEEQRSRIPELVAKIHDLGVVLFIVGPQSTGFESLAMANRCTYDVVPRDRGLSKVDFHKVLNQIGRSVSASRAQTVFRDAKRALFGQDQLVVTVNNEQQGE